LITVGTTCFSLHNRRTNALLDHFGRLLSLEVPLDALYGIGLDGAHIVLHIADTHGLEERHERLLVHVELLRDFIHPDFAHAPRSSIDNSDPFAASTTPSPTSALHVFWRLLRTPELRFVDPEDIEESAAAA